MEKYGHRLVSSTSGEEINAGDKVHVECIKSTGILMDAGWPPYAGPEGGMRGLGSVVVKFGTHTVAMYPELINSIWKEMK